MTAPTPPDPDSRPRQRQGRTTLKVPSRLWRRWWRAQSTASQDRVATFAPLIAVLVFLLAIVLAIGYLRIEEMDREQETITRDVAYAQQRLRLHIISAQDQLTSLAGALTTKRIGTKAFQERTPGLFATSQDLDTVSWLDANNRVIATQSAHTAALTRTRFVGDVIDNARSAGGLDAVKELQQTIFTRPIVNNTTYSGMDDGANFMILVPIFGAGKVKGTLVGEFSIEGLLRYGLPAEVVTKYAVALVDSQGNTLAGNVPPARPMLGDWLPWKAQMPTYELPVSPIGSSLTIKARTWRTSQGVLGSAIFWVIAALSALTIWMLMGNWRHNRRRAEAQHALIAETNFRRAMENSMLTGMRALDMSGCITYVNPAFCQMTGWSESELIGHLPPFPYWPDEDRAMLMGRLEDELKGRSNASGFEVRVQRKNGGIFAARMYVSPLVDPNGVQTGWMTSMTDITEPKRVREELSAAHERFTTVLESLDAAVSVASIGGHELLFANKQYRNWFDDRSLGHYAVITQAQIGLRAEAQRNDDSERVETSELGGIPTTDLLEARANDTEVYMEPLGRWLEVRSRYISWVDGRLAQIVIATDITLRHEAQAQAALQVERAQNASRLITMGEMASSVAHELNQPLTAISNYCSGMVSRLRTKGISEDDLIVALEKTSHQAKRAGQVIARIRAFVKRSEPNRSPTDVNAMVVSASELADIELRRHQVRLMPYVAERLPLLPVDRILIEQVLVNLIKNAAESIQSAGRPVGQRIIELQIKPKRAQDQDGVEFLVQDNGTGIPPEILGRIYDAFYSTKDEGMGIGLKLCRSIVESHQGRMAAQNLYNGEELAGCCFSFWIPTKPSADATSLPPAASRLTEKIKE